MAKTKISEFSSTPANNTDIDSINIAEGCAPSGINDAIRELMAQLKDFQTGAVGDSFNGPIGTSTAAAGAFTTLSASSTVTLSGGTANGVAYLNGSKVVTSGSALTFDGTNLTFDSTGQRVYAVMSGSTLSNRLYFQTSVVNAQTSFSIIPNGTNRQSQYVAYNANDPANASRANIGVDSTSAYFVSDLTGTGSYLPITFSVSGSEGMRLTSTGLGIGTSSPVTKLEVTGDISGTWTSGATRFLGSQYLTGSSYQLGMKTTMDTRETQIFAKAADTGGYVTIATGITPTERVRVDGSGNVGIGTSSPATKLDVSGQITTRGSVAAAVFVSRDGSGAEWSIYNPTGDDLRFFGNSDDRMILTNAGNLALGVTPSASNLATIQSSYGILSGNNQTNIAANAYYNNQWNYTSTAVASLYTQTAGQHRWFNAPSGTAGNAITFTQALTLDSGGSLLIGDTSAPTNGLTSAALSTKGQGTGGSRRATASSMGVTSSLAQNATANTYSFGGYGGYGLFVAEGGDPNAAWRAAAIIWSTGAALTVLNLGSSNITVGSSGTTVTVQNTSASSQAISWSMLVLG